MRARDVGVTEIEHEAGEPRRAGRARRQTHELEVALGTPHAEQLDARLRDLPVLARALLAPAQHRPLVAEAHRQRPIGEPRRRHARDLRRHVGTKRRDLARLGLDEAQHVARIERAEPALEHLGELEGRRRHQLVSVQAKCSSRRRESLRRFSASGGKRSRMPAGRGWIGAFAGAEATSEGGWGLRGPHRGRSLALLYAVSSSGTDHERSGRVLDAFGPGCLALDDRERLAQDRASRLQNGAASQLQRPRAPCLARRT